MRLILSLAAIIFALPFPLLAQESKPPFEVTGGLGVVTFDDDINLQDGPAARVAFAWRPENFAVKRFEVSLTVLDVEVQPNERSDVEQDADIYAIDVIAVPWEIDEGNARYYFFGGFGLTFVDPDTTKSENLASILVGFGVETFFTESFAGYVEARGRFYAEGYGSSDGGWGADGTMGVRFHF